METDARANEHQLLVRIVILLDWLLFGAFGGMVTMWVFASGIAWAHRSITVGAPLFGFVLYVLLLVGGCILLGIWHDHLRGNPPRSWREYLPSRWAIITLVGVFMIGYSFVFFPMVLRWANTILLTELNNDFTIADKAAISIPVTCMPITLFLGMLFGGIGLTVAASWRWHLVGAGGSKDEKALEVMDEG